MLTITIAANHCITRETQLSERGQTWQLQQSAQHDHSLPHNGDQRSARQYGSHARCCPDRCPGQTTRNKTPCREHQKTAP